MTLELSDRQRERLDRIKAECTDDHLPEPTDAQILDSLLDTWDAVGEGLYSGYPDESGKQIHLGVNDWHFRASVTRETAQEDCAE